MYVKKFTSFCQVLKDMHTIKNWFIFSASRCSLLEAGSTKNEQGILPTRMRYDKPHARFGHCRWLYGHANQWVRLSAWDFLSCFIVTIALKCTVSELGMRQTVRQTHGRIAALLKRNAPLWAQYDENLWSWGITGYIFSTRSAVQGHGWWPDAGKELSIATAISASQNVTSQ